jgi:DNA-binding PadR family transcriptional regulator
MVSRRTQPDLMGLTVLALLTTGPRHAWDLHRFIIDTHKDFVTGLPRALYHAVDRLAAQELIAPIETTRHGRRPERTVYQLSDEGRAELHTRLRGLLSTPGRDSTGFVAALSFIGCLSQLDVQRALRSRAADLAGQVRSIELTLTELRETGLPRVLLIEAEFERDRAAAELAWVDSLLADIANGDIDWTMPLPDPPH